jgi:hypothetical protein
VVEDGRSPIDARSCQGRAVDDRRDGRIANDEVVEQGHPRVKIAENDLGKWPAAIVVVIRTGSQIVVEGVVGGDHGGRRYAIRGGTLEVKIIKVQTAVAVVIDQVLTDNDVHIVIGALEIAYTNSFGSSTYCVVLNENGTGSGDAYSRARADGAIAFDEVATDASLHRHNLTRERVAVHVDAGQRVHVCAEKEAMQLNHDGATRYECKSEYQTVGTVSRRIGHCVCGQKRRTLSPVASLL